MRVKPITSWIAIADSAKARIYISKGPQLKLGLVAELDSESARHRSRELLSDKPGRTQSRMGTSSAAMENPSDPQDVEKHKFVRDLVEYLEAGAYREKFDELVLVAAPRTMGEIRKLMSSGLADKIRTELGKDLTNLPEPELKAHLEPLEIGKPHLG